MIRIIIQFVRGLELLPDRGAPALEECIDWVLILPVDLDNIDRDNKSTRSPHYSNLRLTSQTSQNWERSRPLVSHVSTQRRSRWR